MAALVAASSTTHANPPPVPPAVRRALQAASVVVLPSGCGGAVAESPWVVTTALHCVDERDALRVRFRNGAILGARLALTDAVADQAVLILHDAAPVAPLAVVRSLPIVGTVLYFEGNPDRPRLQDSRVDRLGRCESLPDLPDALFTSVEGTPGDSGSPLVDGAARVVGLVHGGARCHIATPGSRLVRLVDRVLGRGRTATGEMRLPS